MNKDIELAIFKALSNGYLPNLSNYPNDLLNKYIHTIYEKDPSGNLYAPVWAQKFNNYCTENGLNICFKALHHTDSMVNKVTTPYPERLYFYLDLQVKSYLMYFDTDPVDIDFID